MRARPIAALFRRAFSNWLDDRAPSMGAAIAYYTVFSIAPMFVLIIAVAGFFFGEKAAAGALFEELAEYVGGDVAAAVQAVLGAASGERRGLLATAIGGGALLIAASAMFAELQASLNVIWKAPPAPGLGVGYFVQSRLLTLLLILAIGCLLVLSLISTAALTMLRAYLESLAPALAVLTDGYELALAFIVPGVLCAMIFKILPDTPVHWRDVWPGALLTAVLFLVGKYGIGLYVGGTNVVSVYGAAGAFVSLLVWAYYCAQILLFGAEFAKACADFRMGSPPALLGDSA